MGDYTALISAGESPGNIVTSGGRVLGMHGGIWNYTVGQRKRLGIGHLEPLHVVVIDKERTRSSYGRKRSSGGARLSRALH